MVPSSASTVLYLEYNSALNAVDDGDKNVYNIDQLTAMKYIKPVRYEVTSNVILTSREHVV